MDSQPENHSLPKGEIRFPNDNRAVFVKVSPREDAADIIKALELKTPATVLLLIGGANELDESLNSQVEKLLRDGIAPAATDMDAVLIDGGTEAGVMALIGKVIAERGRITQLLGIAPEGKVTYPGGPAEDSIPDGAALDPNHSHFVLVGGSEWSSSTEIMFKLVAELTKKSRVVAVLINGGEEAKDEVSRCASHGWPVIVIEGSGRRADEMAVNLDLTLERNQSSFPLSGAPGDLRRLIAVNFETALVDAWRRFAQFDTSASQELKRFRKLLWWSLALGVFGTSLALTQKQLTGVKGLPPFLNAALTYLILAVPIAVTVLLTASNQFKPGKKWSLLRGSAEAVKKEIFRYRARVGPYSYHAIGASEAPISRHGVLAENVAIINQHLMQGLKQTEVTTLSLSAADSPLPPRSALAMSDDGFSFLTPARYVEVRLVDQLDYYYAKIPKLNRKMTQLQWAIFIMGGVGTFLAATGAQLWIAFTTAFVTALTAYVGTLGFEQALVSYNEAATNLSDLRAWWTALSREEKAAQSNRDSLVEMSEEILSSELTGWAQQSGFSLAHLQARSDKTKK